MSRANTWKEALLWLLVVAVPLGIACMPGTDPEDLVSSTFTVVGGGTSTDNTLSGTADLPGGSVSKQAVVAAIVPNVVTVNSFTFGLAGNVIPHTSVIDPGFEALLTAKAADYGYNEFIHTLTFVVSDPFTVNDGDLIEFTVNQSVGGVGPAEARVPVFGTFVDVLQAAPPLDDTWGSPFAVVNIDSPTLGQSMLAGSNVAIEGTLTSPHIEVDFLLVELNGVPAGGGTPVGDSFNFNVTWPIPALQNVSETVVVEVTATDFSERTTVASVSAAAHQLDSDGDLLSNDYEAILNTNPDDPDTDGDGFSDYDEVFFHMTDPLSRDSDGDGDTDDFEVARGHDPNDEMDRFPRKSFSFDHHFAEAEEPTEPVISITPGGDLVMAYIDTEVDGEHVYSLTFSGGVLGTKQEIISPTTAVGGCIAPIDVIRVDAEGDDVAILGTCGGANHLLLDDGVLQIAVGPNEPLVGGDTTLTIEDFSLGTDEGGNLEVLYTGSTAIGAEQVLVSCGPPLATCEILVAAGDVGGDDILMPRHMGGDVMFARDTPASGPPFDELLIIDRGSPAPFPPPFHFIGNGDPVPGQTTFTLDGIDDFSAGEGGAMVTGSIGPSKRMVLLERGFPDGHKLLESRVPRTGQRAPGTTSTYGNIFQGSFENGFFAHGGTTASGLEGAWGSRPLVDPTVAPVDSRMVLVDGDYVPPNPAPGVTGSRIQEVQISTQGVAADGSMAIRLQLFGGDKAVAFAVPGNPEPLVAGFASIVVGSSGTNIVDVVSSPARSDVYFFAPIDGVSGLAVDATGVEWGSSGFGDGGNIYQLNPAGPSLDLVGDTGYDAAPALEFVNGTLFTLVPTATGGADALATVDQGTGAATVVGPLVTPANPGPSMPLEANALVYDATYDELLVLSGIFDGTPGDLFRIDRATAVLTQIANVPAFPSNRQPSGASMSRARELLISFGKGGGEWAWVDLTGFDTSAAPAMPLTELPMRVLIDAASASMPDVVINDSDADGLLDTEEDALGTDALDPDSDGDGLADGAEENVLLTNPLLSDTDGDGLSDGDERTLHFTNPLLTDTDADGASDSDEIAAGSDPNDPGDTPPPNLVDATSDAAIVLLVVSFAALGYALLRRRAGLAR